jgi:hypothetical protein
MPTYGDSARGRGEVVTVEKAAMASVKVETAAKSVTTATEIVK